MTKSIAISDYGTADALRLTDTELPAPGPGQVRVSVRASGVNPIDTKIRSGVMASIFPVEFPHTPGKEAAGVVESVGADVTGFSVGDEVFGPTATGSYAELALADAELLALKPASLPWEVAAGLPVAAETAWRTLEFLHLKAGETLLVHGAAGGVGTLAIQFARARGVRVVGTASAANHDYLRGLGAIPVAYGDGLADRVRAAAPEGVDAALDAVGKGNAIAVSVELTGDAERVVTIAAAPGAHARKVRFSGGGHDENRTRPALAAALALHEAGTLQLPIHRSYPLAEAAAAHRTSEHGHLTGKIVLTVG
ncbi:NADP-dependent oxidoreductase [Streptomyces sp. H27-D2]|uniref:NADP-dependent oxidoreductase n=1 Tax=Streptomyces sp. H27-D2 TaxID=3046304 RepID=UPI002DB85384|nr:NADP-dependent oxidoreductase [Streptomyces sp. H27-D2]MEC4017524.1 NADP-dependent oxidoreductase [Streptomyces sp. H27-D2]